MNKSITLAVTILALEAGCTPEGQYKNNKEFVVYSDVDKTQEKYHRCVNDVYTQHYIVGIVGGPLVPRGGMFNPVSVPNSPGQLDLMIAEPRGRIALRESIKLGEDETYQVINNAKECIQ